MAKKRYTLSLEETLVSALLEQYPGTLSNAIELLMHRPDEKVSNKEVPREFGEHWDNAPWDVIKNSIRDLATLNDIKEEPDE